MNSSNLLAAVISGIISFILVIWLFPIIKWLVLLIIIVLIVLMAFIGFKMYSLKKQNNKDYQNYQQEFKEGNIIDVNYQERVVDEDQE